MDELLRNGIALGFWDRSKLINNDFVAKRCKQLSLFYKNSTFPHSPTLVDTDIDSLLRNAAILNCKWIFVQTFGHLTLRRRFFDLLIDYVKKNDFFLMGHILDYKEAFYELHHQCFLVNLDYYKKFGMPAFGTPTSQDTELLVPKRSRENFHDDYTPFWVEPGDSGEKKVFTPTHEGWNIIHASVENGLRVHNFNTDMRAAKNYLYPTASTANFERALKDPYAVEELELNVCQKNFLRGMAYNWDAGKRSIFMFNTENIGYTHRKLSPEKKLDSLFAVAAGFKPLKILKDNGFHEKTKVVYFDYCLNALNFRKLMLLGWDGTDFVSFLKQHQNIYAYGHYQCVPKNDLSRVPGDPSFADMPHASPDWEKHERLWKKTLDEFGGEEAFRSLWVATRKLPHDFVHCDIIQNPIALSPYIQSAPGMEAAFFWSNSYSVETAYTFIDQVVIEDAFRNWSFLLQHSKKETYLFGTNPKGLDFQHVDKSSYKDLL